MKKDKKYWKAEAKALGERFDEIEETLDRYMFQVIILEDEVDQLKDERDRLKNELNVLRQYNIGKPQTSTSTLSNKDWAVKFIKDHKIPVGMDEKGKKTVENLAKPVEKSIIRWLKFNR
jgi:predicted nuclease with TOPRIM domain